MGILSICLILLAGLPWLVYPQQFDEDVGQISDDELNFIERMIGIGTTPGLTCGNYPIIWELPVEITPGNFVNLDWCACRARVYGDPHMTTLDCVLYNFHGTCTYILAQCGSQFRILSEFYHASPEQEWSNVTSPKNLIVQASGHTILIDLVDPFSGRTKSAYNVFVDGQIRIPPLYFDNLAISSEYGEIKVAGVWGDEGFLINYRGSYPDREIRLFLTAGFTGMIGGLFGNFDGDEFNDFMKPDGTITSDVDEFGSSWKDNTFSAPWCEAWLTPNVNCTAEELAIIEEQCSLFSDPTGPFQDCIPLVDPASYEASCIFDVCAEFGSEHQNIYLCGAYDVYALACQSFGVTVDWRTAEFCPPSCGPNMHFDNNICLSPIPAMCEDTLHTSGCVCDEGFVQQGDQCLDPSELGCVDSNGFIHELGDSWHDCEELCTCVAPDTIECEPADCPSNWECMEAPDDSTSCACKSPMCTGVCSSTEDGFYRASHTIGSRLPKSSTITMAQTEGPISDPCKVKITVVTDKWHTVRRMEINIGVHPNNQAVFYRRFIFNFGPTSGVIVAGYGEGAPHSIEIPEEGYFDGNGEYSVSIQTADDPDSWYIQAYCLSGLGQQLLSMYYATPDPDYFWLFVNQPLHWTGACFPI